MPQMLPLTELPHQRLQATNVLVSDIDDTLTVGGKITLAVMQAMQRLQQAGVLLILVTGRSSGWGQALAGYLPAAPWVLAENGLTLFDARGDLFAIAAEHLQDFDRNRLNAAANSLAAKFDLKPTHDDPFRLYERTFMRPAWYNAATAAEVANGCEPPWEVLASSIHLHVRPRGWGKAEGVAAALKLSAVRAMMVGEPSVLFVGDSGNDRPLFRAYRAASVGVANVQRYREELAEDLPAYVTQQAEGEGFSELCEAILASKPGVLA